MTLDVAIIGGGVSGLAAAHRLNENGFSVTVLERQARAGGNAVSERIGGFLMEHGPSSVNAAMPHALELQAELGLDSRRRELGDGVRNRYLLGDGELNRISVHALGFLTSNYLSPLARLRVLCEAFVPSGADNPDETVAEYWSRRFGAEFAERVIDPLVGGLFAAKADDLSMAAVFPKLLEMEQKHGSIIRGVIRNKVSGGNMPGRGLYSWRDGIGSLPQALATKLGPLVRTGVAVRSIRRERDGYAIDAGEAGCIRARAVIIATQPHVTAGLLEDVDATAATAAAAIKAPPVAVVFFGYRRDQVSHPLDGLGYLSPVSEGRSVSGALFASTMFEDRAPEGHVALSAYIGGSRAPDLAGISADELMAEARAEYADVLGVKGDPVVSRVRQWPLGIPQAGVGHTSLVNDLRSMSDRAPGMFATGNYLNGPSVAACVAEAERTANEVTASLEETRGLSPRDAAQGDGGQKAVAG